MSTVTLITLVVILVLLLVLSAFFSSAETAMMALNRYRLRHQIKEGNRAAQRVFYLLKRPDHLLSAILAGNTFANILASSIATLIFAQFLHGNMAIIIASVVLTTLVLLFSELAPKTIAAYHALSWAKSVSLPLYFFLKVMSPFVIIMTSFANGILWIFGFRAHEVKSPDALSADELRSVVSEAKSRIPAKYLTMLVGILDLQQLNVNDIMIPRSEIVSLDLKGSWEDVLTTIKTSQYTRLPVCEGSLENIIGVLHLRDVSNLLVEGTLTPDICRKSLREPYFIPEGTSLYHQLINFQKYKRRSALVVDEYGDVMGFATLEDILEEIVGDFTTNISASKKIASLQSDGSYLLRGNLNIRIVNELMKWDLPAEGPKTLSGLIIDHLQAIPRAPVCVQIGLCQLTAEKIVKNKIKQVRVYWKRKS